MRGLIAGALGLGLGIFLAHQAGASTVTRDQQWHELVRTVLEAPYQVERQRQVPGQMVAEREPEAVQEVGSQMAGGLQITLVLSRPKGQREMQEMMAQMGMGGMKGM
ncbi:MAG: hypothetical protein HYY85_14540, partial [Deltaproteobacteria bacterium]|nr:hypothetical protein [Deltaproteobacteria bacterium]